MDISQHRFCDIKIRDPETDVCVVVHATIPALPEALQIRDALDRAHQWLSGEDRTLEYTEARTAALALELRSLASFVQRCVLGVDGVFEGLATPARVRGVFWADMSAADQAAVMVEFSNLLLWPVATTLVEGGAPRKLEKSIVPPKDCAPIATK